MNKTTSSRNEINDINKLKKPNTIRYNQSTNTNMILKEKANSYLSKGRFSNLNFLQTIKKEIVDKNYKMTFKDFKNLSIN